MRYILSFIGIFALIFAQTHIVFAVGNGFNPNFLLSDSQMTNTKAITKQEIQHLLTRGTLAGFQTNDILGLKKNAADIIYDVSLQFQLNPQFLLVLLQREQSLVENKSPTQNALDWAMGYAVCDSCSKIDPGIQAYRGFGNQIYYAAKRIRESYLSSLESFGKTLTGIGPGIETIIDGIHIIPQNMATAVLYTYTPHLHGNQNFVTIWNRWFSHQFLEGSLLQDPESGGVWLIQNGTKRPISSKAALLSRFNPQNIIIANENDLDSYPQGFPINFPNYSLLRSPKGTVYLIVDDTKRGFVSKQAFKSAGFMDDEVIDATWDDLNIFLDGEPITSKTKYAQMILLQNKKTGGVFAVENGKKHPIYSKEIMLAHFSSPTIKPTSENELREFETSDALLFPDGTLVGVKGSPDVFVIEKGIRRPILDEATFDSFGWNWHQIVFTNERSVLLHPLGTIVSNALDSSTLISTAKY